MEDGEKKLPQGINLDICFEDYNLIRPNFIPEYTEYQIDGLKVYLNHIKYFFDKKKDFNRDHLMILKLGINKVKRSEFNDMSLMIPIIIDLMNFIDLIKVDLFDKKSKDFIKVYFESLTFCFNKDSNKAYPMLYEKKVMNEFDIKFNIMFSIMVMDKEKIPGNKENLSLATMSMQLPLFELEPEVEYTLEGENILLLPVWMKVSTYPPKSLELAGSKETKGTSPLERIKQKINQFSESSNFKTPEKIKLPLLSGDVVQVNKKQKNGK